MLLDVHLVIFGGATCAGCTLRAMRIRSEKIAAAERALESDSEDDNDPEVKARQLAARLERSGAKYSVRIQMVSLATLAMQAQRRTHKPASALVPRS